MHRLAKAAQITNDSATRFARIDQTSVLIVQCTKMMHTCKTLVEYILDIPFPAMQFASTL